MKSNAGPIQITIATAVGVVAIAIIMEEVDKDATMIAIVLIVPTTTTALYIAKVTMKEQMSLNIAGPMVLVAIQATNAHAVAVAIKSRQPSKTRRAAVPGSANM